MNFLVMTKRPVEIAVLWLQKKQKHMEQFILNITQSIK